jgi:multimeric flavodoxin WrbA
MLLQSLVKGLTDKGAEIETIRLSKLQIKPCLNCGGCDLDGVCVQKDDMQDLFDKLITYDIIVLASPIYFMSVSGWTKKMIDRCQALWVCKYKLNKLPEKPRKARKGVFLSVSGMTKPHVFEAAKVTVQSFFATIHVNYIGNLLFSGIDAKGDIEKHPTALADAEDLGKKLVQEFNNTDFKLPDHKLDMGSEHDRK